MSWFKFLQVLLMVAHKVAGIVQEKRLMQAGEAQGVARSLAALQLRLGVSAAVANEVAALGDDELNDELRGD